MKVIINMAKRLIKASIRLLPFRVEIMLRNLTVVVKNKQSSWKEKLAVLKLPYLIGSPVEFFPVNRNCSENREIIFCHSGHNGDILYSLYFCRELAAFYGMTKFRFHLRTNVGEPGLEAMGHPFKSVRMTVNGAQFLAGMLKQQEYISRVTYGDELPDNAFDLDLFRKMMINFASGQIQNYYYNLVDEHLPREFWKPVIYAEEDFKYRDKIILIATGRYRNVFVDMAALQPFCNDLVFAGLPEEYDDFCQKYFQLEYIGKVDSMMDFAKYFAGAKGVIGNQSGLFALAECMKIPRILVAAEYIICRKTFSTGPVNVQPQGGWCESVSTTEKMVSAIKNLLDYRC
ncbi:MAG: hypothetical protein E7053_06450 [Lentisphaerae bacterium]|nr:hypothetical protein [Lentisphaerota bacterium]